MTKRVNDFTKLQILILIIQNSPKFIFSFHQFRTYLNSSDLQYSSKYLGMSKFRKSKFRGVYKEYHQGLALLSTTFFFSSMRIGQGNINMLRNHFQGGSKMLTFRTIFVIMQGGRVKYSKQYADVLYEWPQQSSRTGNIFCLKSGNIHFYALSYFFSMLGVIRQLCGPDFTQF